VVSGRYVHHVPGSDRVAQVMAQLGVRLAETFHRGADAPRDRGPRPLRGGTGLARAAGEAQGGRELLHQRVHRGESELPGNLCANVVARRDGSELQRRIPSGKASADSAVISAASRVFPIPPGPTTVTMRRSAISCPRRVSSSSRPMNVESEDTGGHYATPAAGMRVAGEALATGDEKRSYPTDEAEEGPHA